MVPRGCSFEHSPLADTALASRVGHSDITESEGGNVPIKHCPAQMLGQQVRRVVIACDLAQTNLLALHSLLQPKGLDVEVLHLPKTRPITSSFAS